MADGSALPVGLDRSSDPVHGPQFVRGQGPYLWDSDGRQYLDFCCSYSSTNFGHAHPRLVAAAVEQLGRLPHVTGHYHPWRERLAEELCSRATLGRPTKAWFCVTGARAFELAWKICFSAKPGRLWTFDLGFHGRSIAVGPKSATPSLPILAAPEAHRLPYPQCHACPMGQRPDSCMAPCLEKIESRLRASSEPNSAIAIEPAAGARGYYFPPPIFFHRLRDLADRLGIRLVSDEVQMGVGRMGHLFASQQLGWKPDLIVLGKSLGGGLVPVSAVVGPAEDLDRVPAGIESETFAASPLAMRIGIEVLRLLDQTDFLEDAMQRGSELRAFLNEQQQRRGLPWQIEGQGASAVVQWMGSPSPASRSRGQPGSPPGEFARHCLAQGLVVHASGILGDRTVFIPPLILTRQELSWAMRKVACALSEMFGEQGRTECPSEVRNSEPFRALD
jgi:4-aminobutyrate aminotransferase-like enzyme